MTRPQLTPEAIDATIERVFQKTEFRLREKGRGVYAGPHEAYGIIAEEMHELLHALGDNDAEAFTKELLDIAVACVIGMASGLPSDTSAEAKEVQP